MTDFDFDQEFDNPSLVDENLVAEAGYPPLESPGDKARRFMTEKKVYSEVEAKRTAALTWAQLEVAEAADRQTAVLAELARLTQIQTQLAFYNTPASAFPDGVRDQFKANLGISVNRLEQTGERE